MSEGKGKARLPSPTDRKPGLLRAALEHSHRFSDREETLAWDGVPLYNNGVRAVADPRMCTEATSAKNFPPELPNFPPDDGLSWKCKDEGAFVAHLDAGLALDATSFPSSRHRPQKSYGPVPAPE